MRPTPKQVRELLEYDPVTGFFRWREPSWRRTSGWFNGIDSHPRYRRICVGKRHYMAHQLAFVLMHGRWPTKEVDHINGCGSDNRWSNLRLVTRNQQMWNAKISKRNTTGVHGVMMVVNKSGRIRFRAFIRVNRKGISCGTFDTVAEAAIARKAAEREYFGEFART